MRSLDWFQTWSIFLESYNWVDGDSLYSFCCWNCKFNERQNIFHLNWFLQIQTLWIGLFKGHDLSFELVTLAGGILIFTALLTVLRWAEQILKPHCDQHDVFELNQILDERLGVASEVINEGCSLRFEVNVSSSWNRWRKTGDPISWWRDSLMT